MPAPHPALRKLWIEAGAASRFRRELARLEYRWSSLLNSSSTLEVLHAEDSLQQLVEFSVFEEPLAEVVARIEAAEELADEPQQSFRRLPEASAEAVDSHEKDCGTSVAKLSNTPYANSGSPKVEAALPERRADLSAVGSERPQLESSGRQPRQRGPAVTFQRPNQEDARRYFCDVIKRARAPIVQDSSRIAPDREFVFEAPAHTRPGRIANVRKPASAPIAAATNDISLSVLTPGLEPSSLQSNPTQPITLSTTISRIVDQEKPSEKAVESGDPISRVLGPAIERLKRRAAVQTTIPHDREPRQRNWSANKNETEPRETLPLTGVQRLAAHALTNMPGNRRLNTNAQVARPVTENYFTSSDYTDFAARLVALLRDETLRHGINIGEVQ